MNTCFNDDARDTVINDVYQIIENYRNNSGKSLHQVEDEIFNYAKDIISNPEFGPDVIRPLAEAINEGIEFADFQDSNAFEIDNIVGKLLYQGTEKIDTSENDINYKLQTTEEAEEAAKVSSDFLNNAFGTAISPRQRMVKEAQINLFDALFVNRGSIENGIQGVINDNDSLNFNIRIYQSNLFKDICNYLKTIDPKYFSEDELEIINNPILFIQNGNNWVNSGNLAKLQNAIERFLSPERFGTSENLQQLYTDKNDIALKAYNASILLKHFDSFLVLKLPKILKIKPTEFNKITGSDDKYQISSHTANTYKTWRTDENFDPGDEIGFITKMLIETTPINMRGDINPTDKFMTFQDYQSLIGKIKMLGLSNRARNLTFTDELINRVFNNLSEKTKKYIRNKSLADVVNYIRRNDRQYLAHVFEVLAHPYFYAAENIDILKSAGINTDIEYNHLWSVNYYIFNGPNSFKNLVGIQQKRDYYHNLTQTSNSIFQKSFIQFYKVREKNKDGVEVTKLKMRLLTSNDLYIRRKNIESSVNQYNTNRLPIDTNKYSDLNETFNANGNPISVSFTVPNSKITATVWLTTGQVTLTNGNMLMEDSGIDFIEDILNLGFKNNPDYLNTLYNLYKDPLKARIALFNLAARVLANRYISQKYLKGLPKSEALTKAQSIFGLNVAYNNNSNQINVVVNNESNNAILIELAKAKYYLEGLSSSTQVKNGENNQISLQGLSFLIGSIGSQISLVEKIENEYGQPDPNTGIKPITKMGSISKDLSIITDNIFIGHFNTDGFKDPLTGKTKTITDFSPGEFAFGQLMYNYFPSVFNKGKTEYEVIGDGFVSFLASVNSDKSTIGQVVFDLNQEVTLPNGTRKKIRDLNSNEIKQMLSKDFGNLYYKLYQTIQFDYNRLTRFINNTYGLPKLSRIDYVTNFQEFNKWYNEAKLTNPELLQNNPIEFIKKAVFDYNQSNRFNPIELIDQLHFKENKGNLQNNQVLLSYIARFNPEKAQYLNLNTELYPTLDQYINLKHIDYLKSALKNELTFNLTGLEFEEDFHKKYKQWVNRSNNIILAKVTINGQQFNVSSTTDLKLIEIETGIKFYDVIDKAENIELMPLLETHNLLDYWLTQQWMDITVGTLVSHPDDKANIKSTEYYDNLIIQDEITLKNNNAYILLHQNNPKELLHIQEIQKQNAIIQQRLNKNKAIRNRISINNIIAMESAMYQAQHKRNVSMTAQMHQFSLNSLEGISEDYTIAVIDDIVNIETILSSINAKTKPYDGATFVNPFTVYLENNSLGENRAGTDKKQFVHFKSPGTCSAGIIKTAGFAITNDRMRFSKQGDGWNSLMIQSTDHIWIDEQGKNPITVDITTDFKGNKINYGKMFFAQNGHRFEIVEIISNGKNSYTRVLNEVDENGKNLGRVTAIKAKQLGIQLQFDNLNSNYKLWQFFGGAYSLSENSKGKLIPSEASIEKVVTAMNNIGFVKTNPETGQKYLVSEIETQDQLFQPLKHSDINYLTTKGAIKQNGANINPNSKYNQRNGKLDIQRIKMYQAGIQLDKEHHADNSDLSLPTQIISACAELGYTFDKADALYKGLASTVRLGIKDMLNIAKQYYDNPTKINEKKLFDETCKILAKELANKQNTDNFAIKIAKSIRQAIQNEIEFDAKLPLSDNTIFNQMISTIASNINKVAIKLKVKGILSVLVPSHNLLKIYGGRKHDSFMFWNEREQDRILVEEQFVPSVSKGEYSFFDADGNYRIMTLEDYQKLSHEDKFLHALQWQSEQDLLYERKTKIINLKEEAKKFSDEELVKLEKDLEEGRIGDPKIQEWYQKAQKAQGAKQYGEFYKDIDDTELPPEQLLLMTLSVSAGKVRYNQKESDVGWTKTGKGLAEQLFGRRHIGGETKTYNWLISKEGKPFDEWVHDIWESFEYNQTWTDQDVKNFIIDSLLTYGSSYNMYMAVIDYEYNRRLQENEDYIQVTQHGRENADYFALDRINKKYNTSFQTYEEIPEQIEILDDNNPFNKFYNIKLGRKYKITTVDGNVHIVHVKNSKILRELKTKLDKVQNISEYIIDGRELGSYNVIFKTEEGETFQFYELDNVSNLQEIDELKNKYDVNYIRQWYKSKYPNENNNNDSVEDLIKRIQRKVQQDMCNLSPNIEDKVIQLTELRNKIFELEKSISQRSSDKIKRQLQIAKKSYFNFLDYHNIKHNNSFDNHSDYINQLRQLQSVSINGIEYHPIKSSCKVEAYELGMSKVYVDEFGFDENTDLYEVENDPMWFVKQGIKKLKYTKVKENQFDIELKRLNGDHIYIISKEHLTNSGLQLSTYDDLIDKTSDQWVRKDNKGEVLYSVPKNTQIYVTPDGQEVFVVDSIDDTVELMKNLDFDFINLSKSLYQQEDYAENLIIKIENDSKLNKYIEEELADYDEYDSKTILDYFKNKHFINQLTEDNYQQLFDKYKEETGKEHILLRKGKIKYSSFLKSLEVVAARIPSQGFQSFMPMKIVVFDNPNVNTAYVSTIQLLLQGSDFDIDSVSLVLYNINKNGQLEVWSPYANLETIELLNSSLELPFPTGEEINIEEQSDKSKAQQFIQKYQSLFDVYYDKDGNIKVSIKSTSVKNLEDIKELLSEKLIPSNTQLKNNLQQIFELLRYNINDDNLSKIVDKVNEYTISESEYKQIESFYQTIDDQINIIDSSISGIAESKESEFILNQLDKLKSKLNKIKSDINNIIEYNQNQLSILIRQLSQLKGRRISVNKMRSILNSFNLKGYDLQTNIFEEIYKTLETKILKFNLNEDTKENTIAIIRNLFENIQSNINNDYKNISNLLNPSLKFENIVPFIRKQLSDDDINQFYNSIKKIIDKHNLYLNEMNSSRVKNILNNQIVYQLYGIIEDPSNQVSAQSPIDTVTNPLKAISKKSEKSKNLNVMSPGNENNKYDILRQMHIAKDCVGISAVGLKGYFMMFQYSCYLLNKGDEFDQKRLFKVASDKNHNTKQIISNLKAKNPGTITNQDILEAIMSIRTQEDQSLVLSALLSLSVDNAKELSLDNLNAGSKTISLYIYGIVHGMDFQDISRLLMSPTAQTVSELCNNNVMYGDASYSKFSSALEYFEKPPEKILAGFKSLSIVEREIRKLNKTDRISIAEMAIEDYKQQLISKYSLDSFLNEEINPEQQAQEEIDNLPLVERERIIWEYEQEFKENEKKNWFIVFLQNCKSDKEALKILENIRKNTLIDKDLRFDFNKLIDFLEKYSIQYKGTYFKQLSQLNFLSKGADEMFKIGQLAGMNKGFPTDVESILRLIGFIEQSISEKEEDQIDLQDFAFNKNKQNKFIETFEQKGKHSTNYLEMLKLVPHLDAYTEALAALDLMFKCSWKYRNIRNLFYKIKSEYKGSADDIINGLSRYLGDKMISNWMIENELQIIIPNGNNIYNPNGNNIYNPNGELNPNPLTEDLKINLGSDYSNATFRKWMEEEIIPNLKKGNLGKRNGMILKSNKFIQDLQPLEITTTVSGNATTVYGLNINMMPKSDVEQTLFDSYKNDFNKLRSYNYVIDTKYGEQSINLADLFQLYALIVFDGRRTERSLMPIFEDVEELGSGIKNGLLPDGILKSLHDYEYYLDLNGNLIEIDDKIIPYVASKKGPWSSYSKYVWGYNEQSGKRMLMIKGREKGGEVAGEYIPPEPGIADYRWMFRDSSLDSNIFTKGINDTKISTEDLFVSDGNKKINFLLEYDPINDIVNVYDVTFAGTENDTLTVNQKIGKNVIIEKKLIKSFGREAIFTRNGIKKVRTNLIKGLIENELNPKPDC